MRVVRAVLLAVIFLSGCQSVPLHTTYDPIGYKPKNPSKVVIKVSLENRMVYVLEGGKPLLVTATAVGLPSKPTPRGHFRVTRKIANKRSGSYGFWVKGDTVVPGKSSKAPGSGYRYVGYPMQYWVEWMPAYGFHLDPYGLCHARARESSVQIELARLGTPVYIARRQPEDATLGQDVPRPRDYNDPDPPNAFLISSRAFVDDPTQHLREQP